MKLAREGGYTRMMLDTVASLGAAISLCHKLGFGEIGLHYHNLFEDVVHFGIDL